MSKLRTAYDKVEDLEATIRAAIQELETANSKGADMVIFGGEKEDINDMRHHVVCALVELITALPNDDTPAPPEDDAPERHSSEGAEIVT